MQSNDIEQLHTALDNMETHLAQGVAKAVMAMAALAEAAKTTPLLLAGLESLMTLEDDMSARLRHLGGVRQAVDSIHDAQTLHIVRSRVAVLGVPGSMAAQPLSQHLLN